MKKIYLFPALRSQYKVLDSFTEELCHALNRQGIESRILEIDREDFPGFLQEMANDPPDCTLSFNGLLPDEEGLFLADILQIPHIAYIVDSPNRFFPITKSPWNIIASIDQSFCETFRQMGSQNVLFMPHAVSRDLQPLDHPEPIYEVLMLNSFIDYEKVRQEWGQKYSTPLIDVLEESALLTLENVDLPYMQAFVETLDRHLRANKKIDPTKIDFPVLLQSLESYIGGKSRVDLLKSIEGVPVHVFGASDRGVSWDKYFANDPHKIVHPPVSFTEAIELMKKAKIVLNCIPEIKYGSHERVLSALACGAAVLALETPYLRENFQEGHDILFFNMQNKDEMNEKIHRYLADEPQRKELALKGRENVINQHTWDQRAKSFVKQLPPILRGLNK